MTIVAALRIEGVPALIGDFLITDVERGADHLWLPTRPNLNDPLYPKLPRRISGLRRKLHLINEHFVVGFTGSVAAGAIIFADLERRFGNDNAAPTIEEINRTLNQFNIQCNGNATVIGWTCRSRPRCFRWSAKPGSSATHVTHAIEGSGSHHFLGILTEARSGGYSGDVKTAYEKALLLGLTKTGAVLFEEIRTGETLQESYGYGAEMVLFDGKRFSFIPRFGYSFWNVRIELNGSVTIMPSNVIAAYEARAGYCALQVTHLGPGDNRLNAENSYLQAITPLHNGMPGLILTKADVVNPECPYYFNGIAFFDARTSAVGTVRFSGIMSENLIFKVRRQGELFLFEWDRKALEEMILDAAGAAHESPAVE